MGADTIFLEEQVKNLKTETQFERFEKENVKGAKAFGDYLVELIDEKGLRVTDIENELIEHISHTYFHECKNNTKNPSRGKVIQIGVAIGATVDEINELLKCAKHSKLYVKDNNDWKIIVGLQRGWEKDKLYDIVEESKKTKRVFRRK